MHSDSPNPSPGADDDADASDPPHSGSFLASSSHAPSMQSAPWQAVNSAHRASRSPAPSVQSHPHNSTGHLAVSGAQEKAMNELSVPKRQKLPSDKDLPPLPHQNQGLFYQARNFSATGNFIDAGSVTLTNNFNISHNFTEEILREMIAAVAASSAARDPPPRSHVKNDALLSPPQSGPSPSQKSQFDVEEKIKDRALPKIPSVTPLPAAADDHQNGRLSPQPDAISFRSQSNFSGGPLAAASVNDLDQYRDKIHPGIYALVTEGRFTKEAVSRLAPTPPKPGTIIPHYNAQLDEPRPQTMHEYLNNYRILFVIDDSRSMARYWSETQVALLEIANYALKNYPDAVDIRFFNSRERKCGLQGADQVMDIFKSVSRSAGTPTGRVLREVLNEQLDRLDVAQKRGTYSSERPLDIIVLTDGVPNVDSPPAPVIVEAAARLNAAKHHPNWIGIQFVQIGDNPLAEPMLLSLIDCKNNNDMVDTVSYSFYKNEGGGKLTPQILERIVLEGLHPNLRLYYNIYRKKVMEKTSQAVY